MIYLRVINLQTTLFFILIISTAKIQEYVNNVSTKEMYPRQNYYKNIIVYRSDK